jgi:16S rRNA G527 N7-methylase RsmG
MTNPDTSGTPQTTDQLNLYVKLLAESARGANLMRPRVIEEVTTIALIDRACGFTPVRLVYSKPAAPSPGGAP